MSGKSVVKPRLWNVHLKNIVEELIKSKLTKMIHKPFQHRMMALVLFGILLLRAVLCVCSNQQCKSVVYHPDESQLLTTGSDRKITYWDCFDG